MSEDDVATLRRSAEVVNRGDWGAFIRMLDPEIVFIPLRAPVQGSYVGHADVERFVADTRETFDLFEWHEDEIRDLGDRLLALGRLRIRGRGSHIETEVPAPLIARLENGLITYFHTFADVGAALDAAGLSE